MDGAADAAPDPIDDEPGIGLSDLIERRAMLLEGYRNALRAAEIASVKVKVYDELIALLEAANPDCPPAGS